LAQEIKNAQRLDLRTTRADSRPDQVRSLTLLGLLAGSSSKRSA
jgi:hypothetical protein